jgi:hypothetical protein
MRQRQSSESPDIFLKNNCLDRIGLSIQKPAAGNVSKAQLASIYYEYLLGCPQGIMD